MKTPISMRIEADLLEAAKGAAAAEHRSLANFVEVALADRIGYRHAERRMEIHVPEGATGLRGAKVVPSDWETAEDIKRAQSAFDRLVDIAAASETPQPDAKGRRPRVKSGR